ncbi:MAG: hypothetical protein ABI402_01920 [Ferruginibacter sp.]
MKMKKNNKFKQKILQTILFIFLMIVYAYQTYAQGEWRMVGEIDSYVNGYVYSLAKDQSGNLFAASGGGVHKYNGSKWTTLSDDIFGFNFGYSVRTVTADNAGNVYASGDSMGNFLVAKWNGSSWTKLIETGSQLSTFNFISLAADNNGNLYASNDEGYIYKWNGIVWTEISPNNYGAVYSITCDGTGKLYAGISVTSVIGGHSYINVWDGVSWTELGAGIGGFNTLGSIYSVITDDQNNVYAAGSYDHVEKWNGTSWTTLGTGTAALNPNERIWTLAVDGQQNVYAAGQFTNNSGKCYVAKWNGTSWLELGTGVNGINSDYDIQAIIVDNAGNICSAVDNHYEYSGSSHMVKWNGTSWLELGSTEASMNSVYPVFDMVMDEANNLYIPASLSFQTSNPSPDHVFVAKWNGTSWSVSTSSISTDGLNSLTRDSNGNFYATKSGNHTIVKWNGISWENLPLNANGIIGRIVIDQQNNVYAAGAFTNSNAKTYVAKWDGNAWTELGSGAAALNGNNSIYDLAIDHTGYIYAAGAFTNAAGKHYVARWNGTGWSELGTGITSLNANDDIIKITTDAAGNVYAGGRFTNASGKKYVAKWNGTSWSEMGSGTNALNANCDIYTILADLNGNVYAGGCFTNANQGKYVAKWNGVSWSESGVVSDAINAISSNTIYSLVMDASGTIYASGGFYDSRAYNWIAKLLAPGIYTFIGNGNWNDPVNWQNNSIPPATLPAGSKIIINPTTGGQCTLSTIQTISPGAFFTVSAGAHFVVTGNLINNQ